MPSVGPLVCHASGSAAGGGTGGESSAGRTTLPSSQVANAAMSMA